METIVNFDWLVYLVECSNVSTINFTDVCIIKIIELLRYDEQTNCESLNPYYLLIFLVKIKSLNSNLINRINNYGLIHFTNECLLPPPLPYALPLIHSTL